MEFSKTHSSLFVKSFLLLVNVFFRRHELSIDLVLRLVLSECIVSLRDQRFSLLLVEKHA